MKIQKKEILIIDDSATNVFLIESVLTENGYNTMSATNAKDAMKLMEKKTPNLILLDLLMPQISGFDLIRTFKQNNNLSHIPIIAVSAITDEDKISEIISLGAIFFLNKPIIINELLDKIQEVFSAH